jgi:UDP-glucose 4-epimerase
VLITGGAGFIGTPLVQFLLEAGSRCCVVDNLSVGLPAPSSHPLLRFEQLDICERPRLEQIVNEFSPDVIVHLAAIHHIPTCDKNAPEAFRVNIVGTQVVLDAAEKARVGRIVAASSGAVYDWHEGPLKVDETPLRPCDTYSLSKFTNEQQIRLWVQKTGKTAMVARIFNTIGAHDPNAHLIPDIIKQLSCGLASPRIQLGNIHTRRDYIYVDDTANCLRVMAMRDVEAGFYVYNVGTGSEADVKTLTSMIAAIRGMQCTIEVDPARVRKVDRAGQLADISATRDALGWSPKYSLEEALQRTVLDRCMVRE